MPDASSYPDCLRRGDTGGHIQTRTVQTEHRYRERYEGLARTWCRQHGQDVVTPLELATDLGYRAASFSANSLRQYHAVIRQHIRDLWDDGAIKLDEIERIDGRLRLQMPAPRNRTRRKGGKTSAGRARSMRPDTLSVLVTVLLERPSPVRQIAAALLEHGTSLATRPSEFLAMEESEPNVFRVPSAKFSESNRRGLDAYRTLPTDGYEPFEIDELRTIVGLIARELEDGATLDSILSRCQRAIREARKVLDGKAKIAPYTARHQGRANLAAMGLAPEEVAVIMGHASAGTAQSHYAPARRGWKGMGGAKPPVVDPALVARVRPANPARGWNAWSDGRPKPR